MRRREFLGVLGGAALGPLESHAQAAEVRMALVIGNSAYRFLPALKTPIGDAQAIGGLLSRAGFAVTSAANLTIPDMRERLRQFGAAFAASGPDTVAVVFYAGHGMQVEHAYYLLPVDARLRERRDLRTQTHPFAELMAALPAGSNRILIVILDTSRSNPYAPKDRARGVVDAPVGTIVAFATSPGAEVIESKGPHSFYTTALLEVMKEPGLAVELMFKKVRIRVHELSARRQLPSETSSLRRNFSFFPARPAR